MKLNAETATKCTSINSTKELRKEKRNIKTKFEKKNKRYHWRNIWDKPLTAPISIVIANNESRTRRIIWQGKEIEKRPNNPSTWDKTKRPPTSWKPVLTRTKSMWNEPSGIDAPETDPEICPETSDVSQPWVATLITRAKSRTQN